MSSSPKISVILPVFNADRYLREALDSIFAQSFTDFELLVINDGSTDESLAIIESFRDKRIRLINNGENLGLIATLNKAIDLCKAPLIARIDADDIMHPERLQKQYERMMQDEGIAVLATRITFINEDGEETGEWNTDGQAVSEAEIRTLMPRTNCIAHPSVMMRTELAKKYAYRSVQKNSEDWDLWLRILADGLRIAKLDEALLKYRIHTTSITAIHKKEEPLQLRLMKARKEFLQYELKRFRINSFVISNLMVQLRNYGKHVWSNRVIPFVRACKRVMTYPPGYTMGEQEKLKRLFENWKGNKLFIFPYLHEGGAEQVHADILKALSDKDAMVLISNFSSNKSFLPRFQESAQLLEIPNLANHPFTAKHCAKQIADELNKREGAHIFGSNSEFFFEIVPLLSEKVKKHYLIHAFKYQQDGNLLHKQWLKYVNAMSTYVFVSHAAMKEFDKFCFYNHVPESGRSKLKFISNAVSEYSKPIEHEQLNVLFVGRDSEEKRAELFLAIAKNIYQSDQEIQFSLIGINPKKATPNVRFIGRIESKKEMNDLYKQHDVLLLTSNREGFPLVIMEAMAHGLAVGSTPVGDVPNRLKNTFSLITSSLEADIVVSELSDFILKLNSDKNLLATMKKAAFDEAQKAFSFDEFERNYRSLFAQ